jgi:hypothetical protein
MVRRPVVTDDDAREVASLLTRGALEERAEPFGSVVRRDDQRGFHERTSKGA